MRNLTKIKITKKKLMLRLKIWFGVTLFLAVFGAVYEHYGHGAYSDFMLYAYAVPMLLGMLPCILFYSEMPRLFPSLPIRLYDAGVITLSLASLVKGALDIYGTSNKLLAVYPAVGILLLVPAFVCLIGKDRV